MRKMTGREGALVLKLDMFKAYDIIEWRFLKLPLQKFGFNQSVVDLTMEGITSMTISFFLKGSPEGFIRPNRGIKQG